MVRGSRRYGFAPVVVALALSACASKSNPDIFTPAPQPSANFPNIGYATWSDAEPPYRLYPGDVLTIETPSAPELNRTVTVQADGRISLPLIQPVMVADRSILDAQAALSRAYAGQLLQYLEAVGASRGAVVYLTLRELDWVECEARDQ